MFLILKLVVELKYQMKKKRKKKINKNDKKEKLELKGKIGKKNDQIKIRKSKKIQSINH